MDGVVPPRAVFGRSGYLKIPEDGFPIENERIARLFQYVQRRVVAADLDGRIRQYGRFREGLAFAVAGKFERRSRNGRTVCERKPKQLGRRRRIVRDVFVEDEEFFLSEEFRGLEPAGGSGLRESDVGNRSGTQASREGISENGSVFLHHAPGIQERRRSGEIGLVGSVIIQIGESEKMGKKDSAGSGVRKFGRQFVGVTSPAPVTFNHERSRSVGYRSENPAGHVSKRAASVAVLGTFHKRRRGGTSGFLPFSGNDSENFRRIGRKSGTSSGDVGFGSARTEALGKEIFRKSGSFFRIEIERPSRFEIPFREPVGPGFLGSVSMDAKDGSVKIGRGRKP